MLLIHLLPLLYQSKKNLSLSPEQIKNLQRKKFLSLVAYASEHSPYYKKIVKERNINIKNCTPEDFPVLTKSTLIENFDEIITIRDVTRAKLAAFLETSKDPDELYLNKYYIMHTSGSSGTIGYYAYNKKEFIRGIVPATRAYGIKFFQKVAYIAATKGHFAGITMVSLAKHLYPLYSNVQTFDINGPFSEIIMKLNNLQPTVVNGYAFALHKLAEAQKEGRLTIKPYILQSGGEPLSTQDKNYIQNVFKAPVVNIYATTEHLIMGLGRDTYQGMYLMEDNLIFEIYPEYTNVTNLYNYTLPLIRYQMSDHLETIADDIHRFPFIKIKEIVGRNEYVPIFTNDDGQDDFISPIVLVEFYVQHLMKFQIHIKSKREFICKVILEDGLTAIEKSKIIEEITFKLKEMLSEKKMMKVKFTVEIVEQLWVDPKTGKFKLIIKN